MIISISIVDDIIVVIYVMSRCSSFSRSSCRSDSSSSYCCCCCTSIAKSNDFGNTRIIVMIRIVPYQERTLESIVILVTVRSATQSLRFSTSICLAGRNGCIVTSECKGGCHLLVRMSDRTVCVLDLVPKY